MEDIEMSDIFSGIGKIGPSYPVKPVLPAQKDREPGKRHKDDRKQPETEKQHDDDDENKPTIDEHV